jgi:hypothetical protein
MYETAKTMQEPSLHQVGIGGSCERNPEIPRVMSALSDSIDRYSDISSRLHDRLSSIATPPEPECGSINKEIGYQTGLASSLDSFRRQIDNVTSGLELLYRRIEL